MKVINIYGNIGYDWWSGDGITAKWFGREFDAALASGEEIEIRINSPGGSVFEGIAIYNKIAANNEKVTTIVDGIAYSMGAIIAMAGKTRKAMKNATVMIHNVSGGAYGNANDLRGALEMMEKLDDALVESLAQFTGLTSADVKSKWFDYRDHTLTAQEALEAKLLTEVVNLNAENVPANLSAMSKEQLFAHYAKLNNSAEQKGLFNQLIAEVRNIVNPKTPVVTEPVPAPNPTDDMKIMINKSSSAIVAALAIPFAENENEKEVELTAEHVASLNSVLAKAQNDVAEANTKITNLTTERDGLKAKVDALPAAAPSTPPAAEKPEGNIPPAVTVNTYETQTDRDLKAIMAIDEEAPKA
jgi:ATP-dependent Clp protease, protease subunit